MIDTGLDRTAELREAFGAFTDVAERLSSAYESLRGSASRLDRELADANARLKAQVGELENLSGSLAAVLRAIPCGVVVAGRDRVLLMANPAAEAILGRKGTSLIGRSADEMADDDDQPLLVLSGGPRSTEERVLCVGGRSRIVDVSVVPVHDAEGTELGLVEVLTDRTELKALRLEVERLDRLAELGRVAAIIAHEIRNPLSGIRGFAGMLVRHFEQESNGGPEAPLRWARRICEGVERADEIIDNVLFLAHPRPMKVHDFDAEAFLCEAYESVARAGTARCQEIDVSIDVSPRNLVVRADRSRLQQALANLVQNAIEACSGPGRVVLSARLRRGRLELAVTDSGPGIADEAVTRLFEPFFTTKTEGSGLGLALVHRVAELHGGSIDVRRGFGTGASFVLVLPLHTDSKEANAS